MAERSYNGRNLLAGQNADFENAPPFVAATTTTSRWIDGTAAGSVADATYKWSFTKDAGTVSARFDPAVAFSGSHSIKVDATDASGKGRVVFGSNSGTGASLTASMLATYAIVVKPNRQYTLSYRVKGITLAGSGGRISVHQHNSNGVRVGSVTQPAGSVNGTFDWTLATGTFTTTINTQYLVLSAEQASAGIQTLWFDDITLTEVLPARSTATSRSTASNRVAVRDMGTALRFGATGANVTSNGNVMPNFSTVDYTVSGWVNARLNISNVASAQQCIFGSGQTTPYWYLVLRNGNYMLRYQDSGEDRQATTPQLPDQRVFLTALLDKANLRIRIYKNGILVATQSVTSFDNPLSETLKVGFLTGQTSLNGIVDEVRLWNRALTADEIKNLYLYNIVPTDGLVAEYLFDEGSGITAIDTSGNGNDGTITGATYTLDVPLEPRASV